LILLFLVFVTNVFNLLIKTAADTANRLLPDPGGVLNTLYIGSEK